MATIFISYRRGDYPSARLLFKELESQFATFFDERIDPGAMWPQVIQEEAEECAIMLVVIGPQWLAKENLERLRDPNDWVRRELQTTLGKANAVRVVPVLCNGARLPTADELPEALVSIPTLQAANLLQWDSDVAALIKKLQSWLSGRSPERVARAPFPRILPYLCDRIEQEEGVQDLVEPRPSGVFACVLHGESLEGHDGFVDRLVYRRLFDRLFRAKDKGVAVTRLDWNRRDAQRGNYANVLRRALGRALETSGSSSDDLLQRLLAPGQPRILVLQVASADYAACGTHLVDRIVAAWFELFGTPRRKPAEPLVLWINVSCTESIDHLWPVLESGRMVLPRLESLREGHILEWIAKPEVKVHLSGREAEVLQISAGGRAVPMLKFVETLEKLVTSN